MNTYDEILAAITVAQTISTLRDLEAVIIDTYIAREITADQVAQLRKAITGRENAIAQLATA